MGLQHGAMHIRAAHGLLMLVASELMASQGLLHNHAALHRAPGMGGAVGGAFLGGGGGAGGAALLLGASSAE